MTQHTGPRVASCSAMSRPASAVPPPAHENERPTVLLIVLGVVLVAALGAAAFVTFTGDGDNGGGGKSVFRSTDSASVNVDFKPTSVTSHNAGVPVQLSPEQTTAIMDTASKYVDAGMIQPLKTGQPVGDVSALFDAATAAQATGPARGALFDEGFAAVSGDINATATGVGVNGLSDGAGTFVLATVGSDLTIVADTGDGELRIHRLTELTLVPEGATWKIAGFDVLVDRQGPGVKNPTATAKSTP